MTKNQPLSEEVKAEIRKEVKQARKDGTPTLASIAAKHDIHPTMISKIAPNGTARTVKAAPKRKIARKPEDEWEKAFEAYIYHRDEAEKARKKLVQIVEQLR